MADKRETGQEVGIPDEGIRIRRGKLTGTSFRLSDGRTLIDWDPQALDARVTIDRKFPRIERPSVMSAKPSTTRR